MIAIDRRTTHNKKHQPNSRDSGNSQCQDPGSQSKASPPGTCLRSGLLLPFGRFLVPSSLPISFLIPIAATECFSQPGLLAKAAPHINNSHSSSNPLHVKCTPGSTPDLFTCSTLCETSQHCKSPSLWHRRVEHPETKKSFLVGPTEPAGGGSLLWVATALAGAGLAWLG